MNLIFVLLTSFFATKIDSPYKILPIKSQGISTDIFQNIYIFHLQTLQKLDTNGNILFSYSNAHLGNIHSIDVSNPLQILVFHKETQALSILSNNLSPISQPILFDNLNLHNVKAVCSSSSGGFWIYDANQRQLLLFNSKLENIYKGTIMFIEDISNIIEHQNIVYAISKDKGYWKFNHKGEYIEYVAVPKLKNIVRFRNKLVLVKEDEIECINYKKIAFPISSANIGLLKDILIIANGSNLEFFKLNFD